jgi:integrase
MKKRAKGSVYQRGAVWWLTYYVDGRRIQESARTKSRRKAESLLTQRRTEIREGTWVDPRKGGARPSSPTVAAYLEQWIAGRETAGVRNVRDERRWMREHVVPAIGRHRIGAVTRADIKALVQEVSTKTSSRTKRPYSPRTVLHIYRTLSTAFADAVRDGVVASTPCTLMTRRGELPQKADARARWRLEAVYSQDEAETLLGAESIPLERRVLYGLMLMAGLRSSEATGRRWGDYDPKAKPLGRLLVATQADGTGGEKPTKTGDVREVPVVPGLAALLAEWRLLYPMRFGIHPRPSDPIVPGPRCKPPELLFRGATTVYMVPHVWGRRGTDRR